MQETGNEILVWLPSPLGDAVLCTPALRAIRQHFKSSEITFFGNPVVREFLSPSNFNDQWLEHDTNNPFVIAKTLKDHGGFYLGVLIEPLINQVKVWIQF